MTPEQKQRIASLREQRKKYAQLPVRYEYPELPTWDDVDFLLSLVKSQEAGCSLCGGPHDFDTSIPSVVWNKVIRARNLPDFLCTTCIVREFVRAGQGFTAELWNGEFNGVPIEVIVNGQNARDAAAIQEENNSLRSELRSSAEAIVNEADKVAFLIHGATIAMHSRCVEKVREEIEALSRTSIAAEQNASELRLLHALYNKLGLLALQEQEAKQS